MNESFVVTGVDMAAAATIGEGICVDIAFADEILDAVRRNNGGVSSVALLAMYVICGMSDVRIVGEYFAVACE